MPREDTTQITDEFQSLLNTQQWQWDKQPKLNKKNFQSDYLVYK